MAVLGWGRGHRPLNLAQTPKFLISSRGVLVVYAVYQPLVFFDSVSYLICHNKTGYTGIYALTVNKRMCTVHPATPSDQTAEFLSLYVLFNVQRLLVGGTISI